MKINSEQSLAMMNNYLSNPVDKNVSTGVASSNAGSQGTDRVELSANGTDIDRLKSTMQESSDFRSDKVAQLQGQISAGTYQVDGKAVAAKMLQSWSELNG